VLPWPIDEIERQRCASITDAERMERAAPAVQRVRKAEIRIELPLDLAAAQIAEIPRIERARAMALGESRELRARLLRGAGGERIEPVEQRPLAHPLHDRDAPRVVILVSEHAPEPVALAHDIEEARVEHERLDAA